MKTYFKSLLYERKVGKRRSKIRVYRGDRLDHGSTAISIPLAH